MTRMEMRKAPKKLCQLMELRHQRGEDYGKLLDAQKAAARRNHKAKIAQ